MLSALLMCSYVFIVGGCNLIATKNGRHGRYGLLMCRYVFSFSWCA